MIILKESGYFMLYLNMFLSRFIWDISLVSFFIHFANRIFETKVDKKWIKVITACLFIVLICIGDICFIDKYFWINDVWFLLLSQLYLSLFFRSYFVENLVASLCYYTTIDFIINVVNLVLDSLEKNESIHETFGMALLHIILAVVVAYIVIERVVVKLLCYRNCYFTNYEFLWLIFFGFISFFSLIFYQDGSFLIIGAVACVAMLLFLSYIQLMRKEEETKEYLIEKNHFLEEQDKLIREKEIEKYKSYKKSINTEERIRRIHHDLMYHFNALLACETLEEVKEYIEKIKGVVKLGDTTYETGSTILDVLLQERCMEAENHGIKFKVIGDFTEGLILDPMSVSIIFGNLLKNSMEACMKIEPEKYKAINVNFYQEPKKEVVIHIDNTNYEKPKMNNNGEIVTTKENEDQLHGIGLQSVRREVLRYGGVMKVSVTDTLFAVDIRIPITPLNAPLAFKEELKKSR